MLMTVTLQEVTTKKQLKQFVSYRNLLYKDCPNYCPVLIADELNTFNKEKNPVFEVAECILYLAYKGDKIVGRIAGIINYAANKHWNVERVRFGWMDFEDDLEISKTLLDAVAEWGKSKGMKELNGPVGFTDLEHQGLLLEGYDHLAPMASLYNFPYYVRHMEEYGLTKENDWIELQITPPTEIPERIERVANIVAQRSKLHVDKVHSVKELKRKYGYSYFDVIDTAYQQLYNFQPLTQRQKIYYSEMYFPLLNFDFVTIIANEAGECVAVGVGMPDVSAAMRKAKGKLFPCGWYHMLKALHAKKMDAFDLLIIAVRPDYVDKGVNAMILYDQIPYFIKYGIKRVETTAIMETNAKCLSTWQFFEQKQHKRRRAYLKQL